ncbi:unnamed protein product [Amoebophrya sp. A25]|nr:unnamed protein product [Amoebophrya sp. A25]|eukprot:GSA25T00001848001.1
MKGEGGKIDSDPRAGRLAEHGWSALKVLGKGQFGVACLVRPGVGNPKAEVIRRDDQGGTFAVAKMISLDFLSEKDNLQAGQEVMLLKQLNHPNIVAYYDHYLAENPIRELVILMEFCEGGELRQKIKDAAKEKTLFKEVQIMRWFCQALSALTYVHKRHILHRDLKSSNIFLKLGDRDCAIGDFGISRVLEGTIDAAATVVGTPYYMSPEVCRSEPYSYKSDIWSLGCVLYEMCMLKHAFESENLLGLVYKIVSDRYDPIPSAYTQDLAALIARLLDKSAHSRPKGDDVNAIAFVRKHMSQLEGGGGLGGGASNYNKRNQVGSDIFSDPRSGGPSTTTSSRRSGQQQEYTKRVAPSLGPGAQKKRKPTPLNFDKPPAEQPPRSAEQPRAAAAGSATPGARSEAAGRAYEQRRQWGGNEQPQSSHSPSPQGSPSYVNHAAPAPAAVPPDPIKAHTTREDEQRLIINLMMSRVRKEVVAQKLNWMHVFAMFDRKSEGILNEPDFNRAMTAMHLGLSHQEIKDIFVSLRGEQGPTENPAVSNAVQVSAFAKALNSIPQSVGLLQDWANTQLLEVGKVALRSNNANVVTKGAKVRISGLRNSPQLNGLEGMATNWDPTACRWIIQLQDGDLKAIKDANLQVVNTGPSPADQAGGEGNELNQSRTPSVALYQKICGSDPSGVVAEKAFLDCLAEVVTGERDRQRMLALAPKNVEGYVDVRALLADEHFVKLSGGRPPQAEGSSSGGQPPCASPRAGGKAGQRYAAPGPAPSGPTFPSSPSRQGPDTQRPGTMPPIPSAAPVAPPPGGVPSTPARGSTTLPSSAANDSSGSSTVILFWRLAQRLNNTRTSLRAVLSLFSPGISAKAGNTGPGIDNKLRADELLEAVSTMPLGLSRVEAHRIFTSLAPGGDGSKTAPIERLEKGIASTAERYGTQAPGCPDNFDRIHFNALNAECLSADPEESGFLPPQTFRMLLMQTEAYLTGSELDWIISVTDKDGDGNLEYATLSWRKTPTQNYRPRWLPPTFIVHQLKHVQRVAPSLPADYVQRVLLARLHKIVQDKQGEGMRPCITFLLDVLSLFPDGEKYVAEQRFGATLGMLLGYLPFGFSKDEAAFLTENAGGKGIMAALSAASSGTVLAEISQWAKSKIGPHTQALRKAMVDQYTHANDEWFMVDELTSCLLLADNSLNDMDLDRFLLLADKNFGGKLLAVDFWRKVAPGESTFLTGITGKNTTARTATSGSGGAGAINPVPSQGGDSQGGGYRKGKTRDDVDRSRRSRICPCLGGRNPQDGG